MIVPARLGVAMQISNLGRSYPQGRLFSRVAETIAAGRIFDQLQRARVNVELFALGAGTRISLLPFTSLFHHGTVSEAKKEVLQ